MWVWLDASRFPQTKLHTISAAVVAPAGKWSLSGGDSCQSFSRVIEPANTSRIGIRTYDDEIVVHDMAPVDAISLVAAEQTSWGRAPISALPPKSDIS
jgi:hypothetical protein